jgi:hypothetical protein
MGPPGHTNLCPDYHSLTDAEIGAVPVAACTRCPCFRVVDEAALFGNRINRPYDPAAMEVSVRMGPPRRQGLHPTSNEYS